MTRNCSSGISQNITNNNKYICTLHTVKRWRLKLFLVLNTCMMMLDLLSFFFFKFAYWQHIANWWMCSTCMWHVSILLQGQCAPNVGGSRELYLKNNDDMKHIDVHPQLTWNIYTTSNTDLSFQHVSNTL